MGYEMWEIWMAIRRFLIGMGSSVRYSVCGKLYPLSRFYCRSICKSYRSIDQWHYADTAHTVWNRICPENGIQIIQVERT